MRVGALPIVEHLHVVEDRPNRFLASLKLVAMNEFALQCREETLDDRVIPAVSTPRHAARDLPAAELVLVVVTRVLGGFNWSSQHLTSEELRWEHRNDGDQIVRCAHRCDRQVGHQVGGVRTCAGK